MNRRDFLRSMLVAVAVATAPPVLRLVLRDAHVPKLLVADWLQVSRTISCHSDEYTRVIDDILRGSTTGDWQKRFKS